MPDHTLGAGLTRAVMKKRSRANLTLVKPLKGDEHRVGHQGRRRGETMRTTAVLKDAIIYAAQLVGEDGEGLNGLVGYLVSIAREDKKTYAALLSRVIPLHVTSTNKTEITYRSAEEVKAELASRGIHVIDNLYA